MAKSKTDAKAGKGGGGAATGGPGKSKIDMTAFLISNGQWLSIAIGGGAAAIMLVLGISSALGAKSTDQIAKTLNDTSASVSAALRSPDGAPPELDEWAKPGHNQFLIVPADKFAANPTRFDPVARPDSRRENPKVMGIEEVQVDLVRAPMKAYDITYNADGEAKIAVLKGKTVAANQTADARAAYGLLRAKTPSAAAAYKAQLEKQQKLLEQLKILQGGGSAAGGGEGGPIGLPGGTGYDATGQRTETVIDYVPLAEMEKKNLIPAYTVVPLRMVVANATLNLKKQLEEMKRALRLQTAQDAAAFPYTYQTANAAGQSVLVQAVGPVFDGYEVQRRVTFPSGKVVEWQPYNYEAAYSQMIDARKVADWFDVIPTKPDSGYLTYFLKKSYDEALALPLPELVGTTEYPLPTKLKSITDTIEKMKLADRRPETESDFQKRLKGTAGRSMFRPRGGTGGGAFGGDGFLNRNTAESAVPVAGGAGVLTNNPNDPKNPGHLFPEIEHLIVRFVDPDVRPGFTYEYQIRVKMRNPNYNQPTLVAKPSDAKQEILVGDWIGLGAAIQVPTESFLYAYDSADYQKKVQEAVTDKVIKSILLPRDGQDVVVQVQSWMEEVRAGAGGKREPVGNWVVAEMPVGRGEYIGRKQYIKLPLWSSEAKQYTLRDVQDKIPKAKETPKGWLVDFSTQSILVDFEGGKVRQQFGSRTVSDEAGAEMLIRRGDGKFIVRNSTGDMQDGGRQERQKTWDEWVKVVETQKKAAADGTDPNNPFSKKP